MLAAGSVPRLRSAVDRIRLEKKKAAGSTGLAG